MVSFVKAAATILGSLMCVGTIGFGTLILICFIVGELQRRGRMRVIRRRNEFETDSLRAARREMEQRALRSEKERKARRAMKEDEEDHFRKIQEIVNES